MLQPTPGVSAGSDPSAAADAGLASELLELIRANILEGADALTPESDLFDAGLDSMAIMQLLLLMEERYGIMLTASDVTRDNFNTAQVLAALLRQRLQERQDAAGNA